jgi:glycine/serine hydroxymethyltransferase
MRQRRVFDASIILTPVDSIPLLYDEPDLSSFLKGLYISDKLKTDAQKRASVIQFAGRETATRDLNLIHQKFAQALGASESSLRLLSGLHAHIVVFMSLAAIGDSVLLLPEVAGGHFATKHILERLGLRVIDMAVDSKRLCVNRDETRRIVDRENPDFVFVDRSEGLRYEDFSFLGELHNTVKIFDASQYLPQIMCGKYANPLSWGFDLLVFTVHKSFPGPQKAGLATARSGALWNQVLKGLSDFVSSAHPENSYKAAFVLSKEQELRSYTARMLDFALDLEERLHAAGVPVFARSGQGEAAWPATQHIWLPMHSDKMAFACFKALASARIQTNYRLLPYGVGWGLRLGTTVLAMADVDAHELAELAAIIVSVLKHGSSLKLRHRVRDLAVHISTQRGRDWRR